MTSSQIVEYFIPTNYNEILDFLIGKEQCKIVNAVYELPNNIESIYYSVCNYSFFTLITSRVSLIIFVLLFYYVRLIIQISNK